MCALLFFSTYSNVKNDDVVVWMCYTFDWSCIVLLLCSLTSMSVGVIVLDKYWITNYYYTQVVRQLHQFLSGIVCDVYRRCHIIPYLLWTLQGSVVVSRTPFEHSASNRHFSIDSVRHSRAFQTSETGGAFNIY